MKCNFEWLSAYLDGALAEEKRAELEEHLKTCEACTAKLEEFARVEQAARKIPVPQLSEAYWENFASRVQNKLTIREKQKTSPGWLEALKSFFQPTTGKVAIAGSAAAILLLTFVSLKQWRTQTFRPPVVVRENPAAESKPDSVPEKGKAAPVMRADEKSSKSGLAEDKKSDQLASGKVIAARPSRPPENVPVAQVPLTAASAPSAPQIAKEEPSMAGYVSSDEAVRGDTVVVTAGKKAEIRKEVATSQVKVAPTESEKLPTQNAVDLRKAQTRVSNPHTKAPVFRVPPDTLKMKRAAAHYDSVFTELRRQGWKGGLVSGPVTVNPFDRMYPAMDTSQLIIEMRQTISAIERKLLTKMSKTDIESLYICLAQYYVQLYRYSLDTNDWKRADQRLTDFLKADLSESARRWLAAIQDELQKLKK